MVKIMSSTYNEVMERRNEIMKKSVGIDYEKFEKNGIGFDYELMMKSQGYDIEKIIKIQRG
jgi:hypothetical protein